MAATTLASGSSTSATTTVSFTAQTAGRLLVLSVTCSDVLAASGTGRPESTGWTRGPDQVDWNETAIFALVATGGETSVQYKIGSANPSVYNLVAYDNGFTGSPMGTSSSLHTHNESPGVSSTGTTAITPTSGASWLVVAAVGGSRDGGSTFTNPTTLTGGYTLQSAAALTTPDTYGNVQGYQVVTGGTATSTSGAWGGGGAKCTYGQLWAFQIASGGTAYPATVTIGATSTVTATPKSALRASVSAPGTSAVTATATSARPASAAAPAASAMTAAPQSALAATVAFTATSTVSFASGGSSPATVLFSASSTLLASAAAGFAAAVTAASTSALTAAVASARPAQVTFTASSTLTATASPSGATVVFTATTTLTVTPRAGLAASVQFVASSTMAAAPQVGEAAAVTISAVSTFTATVHVDYPPVPDVCTLTGSWTATLTETPITRMLVDTPIRHILEDQ